MNFLANAKEMKAYESCLMQETGITSLMLMERAAISVATYVLENQYKKVLVFAGSGNNGADGLAIARLLSETLDSVIVVTEMENDKLSNENLFQRELLEKNGVSLYKAPIEGNFDLVIDAILGIGQNRELSGMILDWVKWINNYRTNHKARVLSVDLPTGIHTDTGLVLSDAVKSDITITFGCPKCGQYLGVGPNYCGNLIVKSIGNLRYMETGCKLINNTILQNFPERNKLGNKGTFGKVLCITGCKNTPGASILNARAVLKSGAGMVQILTDEDNRDLLLRTVPEAMFLPRVSLETNYLNKAMQWCNNVVIGCGMGLTRNSEELLKLVMEQCTKPLVIDADAITLLAQEKDLLKKRKDASLVTIVTPHPKEFARLFENEDKSQNHQNPDTLRLLAKEYGCIIVAKDAKTIVANEEEVWINSSGNDALATAGSGDVLAGMIASFLCVCSPMEACKTAVYCHGLAGEDAGKRIGKMSVMANDIIDSFPNVLKQITNMSEAL